MKSKILSLLILLTLGACSPTRPPVPVGTIPKPKAPSISEEQYGHKVLQTMSEKFEIDYNDPRLNDIIDITDKLTRAADAHNNPWHVYLFKAPQVKNAAATRGNHVFVWSGMLDATKNDGEIATILAHEIAHVLAGHTDPDPNEQAKKILIRIGAMAAGIAVSQGVGDPNAAANLGRITATLTDQVGQGILVNPYSKKLELEADHVGMMIMAEAGYDPQDALNFWDRASKDKTFGGSGTAFFSTHPVAENRLESLQKALPKALKRYNKNSSSPSKARTSRSQPKQYAQNWTDKYYGKGQKKTNSESAKSTNSQDSVSISKDASDWTAPNSSNDKPIVGNLDTDTGEKLPQFAIGDSDKQTPAVRQDFKVIVGRSFLFSSKSKSSKKIGEFKKGAVITAIRDHGTWVEINFPDEGYVSKEELAPIY